MQSIFDTADRDSLMTRLAQLQPANARLWGTMSPAQMLAHCANVLETGAGVRPMKQKFIGKLLAPLVRKSILGEKPFSRNSPTDPSFVISNERDFAAERTRLTGLIGLFVERGAAAAGSQTHAFFGNLSGEEWGRLTYKHLDHHLRQFGA